MEQKTLHVPMDEFRAHCMELIDHVRITGEPVVVTWLGSPVVRLQPCRRAGWKRATADEDPWAPCWDPEAVE